MDSPTWHKNCLRISFCLQMVESNSERNTLKLLRNRHYTPNVCYLAISQGWFIETNTYFPYNGLYYLTVNWSHCDVSGVGFIHQLGSGYRHPFAIVGLIICMQGRGFNPPLIQTIHLQLYFNNCSFHGEGGCTLFSLWLGWFLEILEYLIGIIAI